MTDLLLNRTIDQTMLRPEATVADVRRLLEEAAGLDFASVCIPPVHVPLAATVLAGSAVRVGTVVAFPFGYARPAVRIAESRQAVADGARELDTVIDLSWLKSGEDALALDDLAGGVAAMRQEGDDLTLKVIVETALLDEAEKVRAARLVVASGADFVKTSTGFASSSTGSASASTGSASGGTGGGATVEDVALLARTVAGRIGVKASGGIRDLATARAMLAAGARRLGTSAGARLLAEARQVSA